jgi:hypothetical protein
MTELSAAPAPRRIAYLIAAALFVPTLLFSLLLFVSRLRSFNSTAWFDYAAIVVCTLLGASFIWRIGRTLEAKLILTSLLGVLLWTWLWGYGLVFVCSVYRDCL